jgi:predicted acylesterase/phospholipase RssA
VDSNTANESATRCGGCPGNPQSSIRIGLALSSGGARGFAHVGVIKALREAGFTIAGVAGSSMGGIMAAGYAIRADVAELERRVLDFRARDHMRRVLPVMDAARITAFLDDILGGAQFADCAVPLAIVATDLQRRAPATLKEGPVALAAFASSAVPFLHRPVAWGERLLADGSLSCVLPTAQVQGEGIDLVIGSLVSHPRAMLNGVVGGMARNVGGAIRGWGRHYVEYFREHLPHLAWPELAPELDESLRTLILTPNLDRVGPLDFNRMRDAIAAGEEAVWSRIEEIRALLARDQ